MAGKISHLFLLAGLCFSTLLSFGLINGKLLYSIAAIVLRKTTLPFNALYIVASIQGEARRSEGTYVATCCDHRGIILKITKLQR